MATEAFTTEALTLQDGTDVELKPLVIGKMRKFTKTWSEYMGFINSKVKEAADREGEVEFNFDDSELSDRQYDTYIELSLLCIGDQIEGKTPAKLKEYLENTLDEPTIYKILLKCGNLKLGEIDPNQQDQTVTVPAGTN